MNIVFNDSIGIGQVSRQTCPANYTLGELPKPVGFIVINIQLQIMPKPAVSQLIDTKHILAFVLSHNN